MTLRARMHGGGRPPAPSRPQLAALPPVRERPHYFVAPHGEGRRDWAGTCLRCNRAWDDGVHFKPAEGL